MDALKQRNEELDLSCETLKKVHINPLTECWEE